MNQATVMGVDYGDLGLKVICLEDGRFVTVLDAQEDREPLIYFDSMANVSGLGVGFPSITRGVGNGVYFALQGHRLTCDILIQNHLARLYQSLKKSQGQSAQIVLAVPAALGQSRRHALLGCVREAGFVSAALLDRCTAAALGHRGRVAGDTKPATVLAYHCDYSDCEYALVRLTRGRCRVVGAGIVPGLSGERLDAVVMENIVLGLRERGIVLGLKQYSARQWLEFRDRAERARLTLTRHDSVAAELPRDLTPTGEVIKLRMEASGFGARIAPWVESSLDAVGGMLEQNGLSWEAIDTVLASGEVATNPPVLGMLAQRLGREPVKGAPDLIAKGAVIHAQELALGGGGGSEMELVPSEMNPTESGDLASASDRQRPHFVSAVELTQAVERSTSPISAATDDGLDQIRRLIHQGRDAEALDLIKAHERELIALRERIGGETVSRPEDLIQYADALLAIGRYHEAVGLAHQAYQLSPSNAKVFVEMLRIHNEAGLALTRPEDFAAAMAILHCAHHHDQTDRSVHKALAERLYLQAEAMHRKGDAEAARRYLEEALTFAPNHQHAHLLLDQLQTSDPPPVG